MKTVAIIQARMGSTRLHGKVLEKLNGLEALGWTVRAAQATTGIDEVWIATSDKAGDDAVALWAELNKVPVHRGSEHDVLDRYAGAARVSGAEVVVRLTADCPLLDPAVVTQVVGLRAMTGVDYASNVDPPTWPDGLDCEVVTVPVLLAASREAVRPFDREHVTPFIRNNRSRFSARNLQAPLPGLAEERWTLDTKADLEFLVSTAKHLPRDRPPTYLEVLAVLDREPQLREINRGLVRNAACVDSISKR
jgi:glutamate-1-semialdehyde 2,1-aminomutase/spore coat polysaccharide biosynthesis protein SpsF